MNDSGPGDIDMSRFQRVVSLAVLGLWLCVGCGEDPVAPHSQDQVPLLVVVQAGSFVMGDGTSAPCQVEHEVTLSHDFSIGKYEVTNREYLEMLQWAYDQVPPLAVCNPSGNAVLAPGDSSIVLLKLFGTGGIGFDENTGKFFVFPGRAEHPVVQVTWYGAVSYCIWLSWARGEDPAYLPQTWEIDGESPYETPSYRLPTEAEWEYVASAASDSLYPWGNGQQQVDANALGVVGDTTPVGSYGPIADAWPIYDMAGNALEWCHDRFECELGSAQVSNPAGPTSGIERVVRGGSWATMDLLGLQCAWRGSYSPGYQAVVHTTGFRIARTMQ